MNWEWLWRKRRLVLVGAGLGVVVFRVMAAQTDSKLWSIPADLALIVFGTCLALMSDELGARQVRRQFLTGGYLQSALQPDSPDLLSLGNLVIGSAANGLGVADLIAKVSGQDSLGDFLGVLVAVATFLVAAACSGRIGPRGRRREAGPTEEEE
jgi:hypothetical protein